MIDYALLCQTIADWRSGRRPTFPPSSTPTLPGGDTYSGGAVGDGSMEEVDSDLIVVDEYGEQQGAPEGYVSPDRTPPTPPAEYDSTMVYGGEYGEPREE